MEVRRLHVAIEECGARLEALDAPCPWVRLFSEDVRLDERLPDYQVRVKDSNIAGVGVPVFAGVDVKRKAYDLHETTPWIDDGIEAVGGLLALRAEMAVLSRAHSLLSEELRTTSQRVNLFEKVKIPEARENIRVIRIFLGDEQTASVARAKLAKGRVVAAL